MSFSIFQAAHICRIGVEETRGKLKRCWSTLPLLDSWLIEAFTL